MKRVSSLLLIFSVSISSVVVVSQLYGDDEGPPKCCGTHSCAGPCLWYQGPFGEDRSMQVVKDGDWPPHCRVSLWEADQGKTCADDPENEVKCGTLKFYLGHQCNEWAEEGELPNDVPRCLVPQSDDCWWMTPP